MAFPRSIFLLVCASVLFIAFVESKEPELTEFGKKVKKCMSDETYKKVFNIKKGSTDDDLKKAIQESSKKFAELLDFTYSKADEEKVEKETRELGISNLNSSVLFHCHTYGISKSFTDLGYLDSDNIDDLAQKYCDAYDKVAETLEKDDLVSTFNAIVTAVADFLKTEGHTLKDVVKKLEKAYNEEFKKYNKKHGLVGSALDVLPIS